MTPEQEQYNSIKLAALRRHELIKLIRTGLDREEQLIQEAAEKDKEIERLEKHIEKIERAGYA